MYKPTLVDGEYALKTKQTESTPAQKNSQNGIHERLDVSHLASMKFSCTIFFLSTDSEMRNNLLNKRALTFRWLSAYELGS